MSTSGDVWIFGYGSLVWRPAFEYLDKQPAYIKGWMRRFWQASPDHRGTPEAPGRVVTLLRAEGDTCWGMAYLVSKAVAEPILKELDHREKAGYERVLTPIYDASNAVIDEGTLVYIAGPTNPSFLGESPLEEIADAVVHSIGPSGANTEYVLRLADALDEMGVVDPHVQTLASLVRKRS